MQFEGLQKALEWDDDVKSALLQRDPQVRKAMEGDTGARVDIERDASLRRTLFDHTISLVIDMRRIVDVRRGTSRILRQMKLDANVDHKNWPDWEEEYWKYIKNCVSLC